METQQMPVLFISHGLGPGWMLDSTNVHPGLKELDSTSKSAQFMKNSPAKLHLPLPRAILVVSAHWSEEDFSITSSSKPDLVYDYYGFSNDAYDIKWKPPGAPDIAEEIKDTMEAKGLPCKLDKTRGLDHGVFLPLMFIWPDANIPVLQLSMKDSLDLSEHTKLGECLQPLRNNGILIVCSGQATHNVSAIFPGKPVIAWAKKFGMWLTDLVCSRRFTTEKRRSLMEDSEKHELFHKAHPSIEHYLPLSVAMAAAGYNFGTQVYEEYVLGSIYITHFLWK